MREDSCGIPCREVGRNADDEIIAGWDQEREWSGPCGKVFAGEPEDPTNRNPWAWLG